MANLYWVLEIWQIEPVYKNIIEYIDYDWQEFHQWTWKFNINLIWMYLLKPHKYSSLFIMYVAEFA